jgi:hypothetical protein
MFKFITLFVFLLSTYVLADEKIKGIYVGEIEDKYKNTYPVTTNLEITDAGVIKGQYEYKYGGKNWNGIFYDGKLSGEDLLIYWKEETRQGWLAIKFDKKHTSFSGTWGSTNNNGNWSGKK